MYKIFTFEKVIWESSIRKAVIIINYHYNNKSHSLHNFSYNLYIKFHPCRTGKFKLCCNEYVAEASKDDES